MARTAFVKVCGGVLASLALGGACGGTSSPLGPLADASTEGGEPGEGGASDAGGAYTLDNVCERTAPRVCAIRKGCCEKTAGYDEATCLTREREACAKDVAEVRAGTMTFDPARLEACVASLTPLIDKCTLGVEDFGDAAAILKDCHVFAGKLGEGVACTRDNQCAPSTSADAFVGCEEQKKTCRTIRILGAGATCELGDGFAAVCGKGLYCDIDFQDPPPRQGTCKTALGLGATCSQAKPLECGLGYYCDASNKCVAGKAGGASCTDALQCASLVCQRTNDAGPGTCKPVDPIVKKYECGK